MGLEEAIVQGDVQGVRSVCRSGGAEANARLANGQTPLAFAVGVAGVPVIRALLAAFADPTMTNSTGEDALERAVKLKRKNVFRLLSSRFDADRVAEDERRMPYHINPPPAARKADDPFWDHPAAVLARARKESAADGERAARLVAAALDGDVATAKDLLAAAVNPDVLDISRNNLTALIAAMLKRHVNVIAALAEAGADLDAAPLGMDCPLLVAIEWGSVELIRALGEGGADLTKSNRAGVTPLDFARQKRSLDAERELLRLGADRLRGPEEALPLPPALPPEPPPLFAPSHDGDEPPSDDYFGLPTADVISCGLLIQAEVGASASALFELIDADLHHHNAMNREVSRLDNAYIVWRLAGHVWTAITQLDFTSGVLTPAHAAALARELNARAIFVRICDTAGSGEYALFDENGAVQEVFEMNDGVEWLEESGEIANAVGERFQIDMSPLAERMTSDHSLSFGSTVRQMTAGAIDNPWKFFGEFLEQQRALSPSAWSPESCFEAGSGANMLKLIVPEEDFGYDAVFERIDYVAVTGLVGQ